MERFATCGVCGCVCDTRDLAWVEDGGRRPVSWDTRPRTRTGGRLGAWPELARTTIPSGARVCFRCRDVAPPVAPAPLWKQAAGAWEEAVRANPDLAKFQPRRRPL